jgi:hypothetical protein
MIEDRGRIGGRGGSLHTEDSSGKHELFSASYKSDGYAPVFWELLLEGAHQTHRVDADDLATKNAAGFSTGRLQRALHGHARQRGAAFGCSLWCRRRSRRGRLVATGAASQGVLSRAVRGDSFARGDATVARRRGPLILSSCVPPAFRRGKLGN